MYDFWSYIFNIKKERFTLYFFSQKYKRVVEVCNCCDSYDLIDFSSANLELVFLVHIQQR